MIQKPKAVFCWSGGKDSSLALHTILKEDSFDIVALLTTLNYHFKRISMHGIREDLLNLQAASVGIPLEKVWVAEGNNAEYERVMEEKMLAFKNTGVTHVIFGDIFLEDLRSYRENNLAKINLTAVFPLWKKDTNKLIKEFWQEGFETITCCINNKTLDESFLGKIINTGFINRLPAAVDPCGENGEFHSFCYKGPLFKKEITFFTGEMVTKDGFGFIDLVPAQDSTSISEKIKK